MTTTPAHTLRLEAGGAAPRGTPTRRVALAAVGLTGAVAAVQFGGTDAGPGLCVVRACTGGWCPGCGGARAAHHLLHGELAAAWADHPWVVLAAAQLFVVAIVALSAFAWASRSTPSLQRPRQGRASPSRALLAVVLLVNAGSLLAIWFVRLATGSIPSPFSA